MMLDGPRRDAMICSENRCIDGARCRFVCLEWSPVRPKFLVGTFDGTAEAVPENVFHQPDRL
jgi:hypothetical protein